jgi:hypothetical protein
VPVLVVVVVVVMPSTRRKRYEALTELHFRQDNVKTALRNLPNERERCRNGFLCMMCKPDYILAMVMGLHRRLGAESAVAVLTGDLVHMIIEMINPKRQIPRWLSCSWDVNVGKRNQARALLKCSRAAQRERDDRMDYTNSASQITNIVEAV